MDARTKEQFRSQLQMLRNDERKALDKLIEIRGSIKVVEFMKFELEQPEKQAVEVINGSTPPPDEVKPNG